MADYVVRMTGQDNLSGTIKQVKSELNDLGKTTSKLDQIDKKFEKITQSAVGVKKEMRDLTTLGRQLKFDGDYNAAQLLKIAKAAGEAKDAMDDFDAMRKFFADDRRWLNTAVQGMQGLAAAGSVTAGVLGMVGVEQEKVNQAILYCQSALSVLNGIKTIANLLDKQGYLMTAAKVLGLKAEAKAIDTATEAQVRNNIAVKACPYVAVAVAVAALVTGIIELAEALDESSKKQEELTEAAENHREAVDSQNQTLADNISKFRTLQKRWNDLGNDLNAKKRFVVENQTAFNDLSLSVHDVNDAEGALVIHANAIVGAMQAKALAMAGTIEMSNNYRKALEKVSKIEEKIAKGEKLTRAELEEVGFKDPYNDKRFKYKGYDYWGLGSLAGAGHEQYEVVDPDSVIEDIRKDAIAKADKNNAKIRKTVDKALDAANSAPYYNPNGAPHSGSGRPGKGGSGTGGSGNNASDYDANSLADYQAQLAKVNDDLNKRNLSEADLNEKLRERARLEGIITRIENGRKTAKELGLDKIVNLDGNSLQDTINRLAKTLDPVKVKIQAEFDKKKSWEKTMQILQENYFKQQQEDLQNYMSTIDDVGSAFGSLGSIFKATGDESTAAVMQIVGTTLQGVSQVIPQIMALIGAKQGEALASGTASAAGLPFPANIAAIASITATILATFASIASVVGSFASGGIVGGGTYYGDHILARVNAGEMILNRKQQSNLFRAIESGGIGSGSTVMIPDLRIKGSDLYVSFRNYSKSVSKTGKTTGIL